MIEQLICAFILGGIICVIGQLLMDVGKLTPAHTLCLIVVAGSVLGGLGLFQKLVDWGGMGASLTIASFGNSLVKGALEGALSSGFWGLFSGMLEPVSAGIAAVVVCGFVVALVFRPKQ